MSLLPNHTPQTQKVPILYVDERDDTDPSDTFMSIIAKMGNDQVDISKYI